MRAIEIEKFGDVNVLKEVEKPLPTPKRDEVRIRIKSVGFNPVDAKIRAGAIPVPLPCILGSECSGIIEAVGDLNREFSVGDEVCALVSGQGSNGSYAEAVTVPTAFVLKKPKGLSFDEAASFPLTGLTAFQALIATRALQQESSLFIAGGAGGVGSMAIALAQTLQSGPIYTTAGSEESLSYLVQRYHVPRKNILLYRGLSLAEMKEKLLESHGGPFAVTFDCVGREMKKLCFEVVDYYGHVSTILQEGKQFPLEVWERGASITFDKCLSVHFIYLRSAAMNYDPKYWMIYKTQLRELGRLIEGGMKLPQVTNVGTLSVETVKKAHQLLEKGHTHGKLVMNLS